MKTNDLTEKDLKIELDSLKEQFNNKKYDELFIAWFLRAFITENEEEAISALTGTAGDKDVDAILIDDNSKHVFIVQGKYRAKISAMSEKRPDVVSFATISNKISGHKNEFDSLVENISPVISDKLVEARNRIIKRGYTLQLFYVTLGKCSKNLTKEAESIVKNSQCNASIEFFTGNRVLLLLADYLEGVAPPIPSIGLEMESGRGISVDGIHQRYDQKTEIESWIFSMAGQSIASIYEKAGTRIFARNVRGFLGSTDINQSMEDTLGKEPQFFWYYNNGITIVCDFAEERSRQGKKILYVENPQIINGQQTTRTLFKLVKKESVSSVLIRVIRIPREAGKKHEKFESLISSIVNATNWQNAIKASDLMSNDRKQIEIEREFRKQRYLYIRKRQSKSEAKKASGSNYLRSVKKEEIARAVATCDINSVIPRKGIETLFNEDHYKVIFHNSDPFYYLNRYWLMKQVAKCQRGERDRGRMKWLVIYFTWNFLSKLLRSRGAVEYYIRQCEIGGEITTPLRMSINSVFNSAKLFYGKNSGKGKEKIEVDSFFRKSGIDSSFLKFWNGRTNKYKKSFNKNWSKFEKCLKDGM